MSYRILTIDPGSTSTKIGVFDDEKMLFEENLHHSAEELAQFETIPQQEAFRRRLVLKALEEHHIPLESLSAVCGRGGVLKPVHGGTYLTTDAMIDTLKKGPYGHHASNLGGLLAREIGSALHIPSYIVDPPVVDELAPLARYSGHPLITRRSIFHALNQKAVAKRYAKEIGKPYESLNLIVCHMGGGGHLAQSHGPGVAPATALLVEVQTIAGIAGAGGELGLHGAAVGGEAAPEADAAAVVGGGKVRTGGPEDAVIQRDVGADGCALGTLVSLEHGTAVGVVILHCQRAGDEHIQRGAAPAPAIDRQAAAAAQLHLAAAVYGGSAAAGEGAGGTVGQIDGGPVGQDQRMGAVVADRQGQARESQGLGTLCPRPAVAGGILRDGGQVHGSGHRRRLLSQDLHRQHG